VFTREGRYSKCRHPQSVGVLVSCFDRPFGEADGLGYLGIRNRTPSLHPLGEATPTDQGRGRRVGGVDCKSPLQQRDALANCRRGVLVRKRKGTQIQIVRVKVFDRLAGRPLDLGLAQLRLDRADHVTCHLVLQGEDIIERTVETVGPDMRSGCRVDQLTSDPHSVARLAHATFEHLTHAQFAAPA